MLQSSFGSRPSFGAAHVRDTGFPPAPSHFPHRRPCGTVDARLGRRAILSFQYHPNCRADECRRFVVENRPGALQTIAMNDVSGRPADGYSLLTMSLPMTVTPSLFPRAE